MPTTPPELSSIHIERSGGLAGLRAHADVTAGDLSTAQRAAVGQLLAAAPAPAASKGAPTRGADRYSFRVCVRSADGSEKVLTVSEDEMPDALADLAKPQLR